MSKDQKHSNQIQCPDCKDWISPFDSLSGYCSLCADKRINHTKQLESELAAAKARIADITMRFEALDESAMTCMDERNDLAQKLAEARAENKRLRGTIGSMMGACGLPDPVEACRTAIEWGNEGLKDHIGDANKKDGD